MNPIFLTSNIIYILLSFILYLFDNGTYEYEILFLSVSYTLISFVSFIFFNNDIRFRYKWLKPSNLFVLALLIVNIQLFIDLLLGYRSISDSVFISSSLINKGTLLSSGCIVAFITGNLLKSFRSKKIPKINVLKVRYVPSVYILLSVVVFGIFLKQLGRDFYTGVAYLQSGGYDAEVGILNYIELLLNAINATILIMYSYLNKDNNKISDVRSYFKYMPWIFWLSFFAYVFLRLISGDRGPFIYSLLLLFYSITYCIGFNLKLKTVILIIICGGLFLTAVGIGRTYGEGMSFLQKLEKGIKGERLYAREEAETISPATVELAGSLKCNQIALDGVHLKKDNTIHYGGYLFLGIVKSIPFLSSSLKTFNVKPRDASTSNYITTSYLGNEYTYGLGTTCVADFYLDFGFIGSLVMMFILGVGFKYIDGKIYDVASDYSIYSIAICIWIASKVIYIPRSTITLEVKPLIIIFILIYIGKYFKIKYE